MGQKTKNASDCVQRADKGGVMMTDQRVIMMTLVVMNTIEAVMVVNMSPVLFCVHAGLVVWCRKDPFIHRY